MSDVSSGLLPPGVTAKELSSAIDRFVDVLGSDRVLTSEADRREFRDPFTYVGWDHYTASAIVMPTTVEEVQAIVRIANETKVPLWTHGQGRNNGYGGAGPRVGGAVVVSMRKMDRVLEINEQLGYALVEPGVRWFDLYEAVRAGGHKLMVPIADVGWGSVVGNTLDNGVTYLPESFDRQAFCGMEVVLANGDVMRTGMGAMDENRSWNLYKRSMGPSLDLLFTQSNFGIVTKMGYWLMPQPEVYMPIWIRVWNDDDIAPMIDTYRTLALGGTIRMMPQVGNTILMASLLSAREQWHRDAGPIPEETIQRMARELESGRWLMRCALYGDEAVVDHRLEKIKAAFAHGVPGCDVWASKCAPEDIPDLQNPAERTQGGVPSLEYNRLAAWYGGEEGGHLDFSPVAPTTGKDTIVLRDLYRRVMEGASLDYMGAVLPVNARSMLHMAVINFDTTNEAQARIGFDVAKRLVVEGGKLGYGAYRPHPDFMDLAAEQYAYNDHAYRRFNETLKDALDPNGILAPGKQGIWPAALRDPANRPDGYPSELDGVLR